MGFPCLAVAAIRGSLAVLLVAGSTTEAAAPSKDAKTKTITVTGLVTLPDGQPAPDAMVSVRQHGKPITTRTNASGKFSLDLLAGGARGATMAASGPAGTLGQVNLPWEIDANKPVDSQLIELKPPRVLDVTVVDAAGKPAGGALVTAASNYRAVATATADDAGRATLPVPQDAQLQFVLAAKPREGVDYLLFRSPTAPVTDPYQLPPDHSEPLTLQLSPTCTVTIHVEDQTGQPVAGAEVTPWLVQLPKKGGDANLGDVWAQDTNDRGEALFETIPAHHESDIVFWVRKEGLIANERTLLESNSKDDKLVARLLPLVPVSGRVIHADGSPAANITVRAVGDGHGMDGYRAETATGSDGTFQFEVYPDHYCLFAAGNDEWASPAVARVVRLGRHIDDIELKLGPGRQCVKACRRLIA